MKKVIFVINNLQGNGAERFVLNLYKALEQYAAVTCAIVCFEQRIDYDISTYPYHIHYVNINRNKRNRQAQAKLVDDFILTQLGQPNLVLSNLTTADKILCHSQLDCVYHVIHSTTSIEHLSDRQGLKRWWAAFKLRQLYAKRKMIAVSEGVKQDMLELLGKPADITTIYNPVDADAIALAAQLMPPQLIVPENYIIHIGKFNRAKRHDRLIHAFASINSNVNLVLIGQGYLESQTRSLVTALGVAERVIFLGAQANPYPFLKQAKLLVLTSDFEGLSMVLLEAIALNVPVVAVDCPHGPREVIGQQAPQCLIALEQAAQQLPMAIDQALQYPDHYRVPLQDKFAMRTAATAYQQLLR